MPRVSLRTSIQSHISNQFAKAFITSRWPPALLAKTAHRCSLGITRDLLPVTMSDHQAVTDDVVVSQSRDCILHLYLQPDSPSSLPYGPSSVINHEHRPAQQQRLQQQPIYIPPHHLPRQIAGTLRNLISDTVSHHIKPITPRQQARLGKFVRWQGLNFRRVLAGIARVEEGIIKPGRKFPGRGR